MRKQVNHPPDEVMTRLESTLRNESRNLGYKKIWPTPWRLPQVSTLLALVLLRVGVLVYLLLGRDEISSRWIGRGALLDLVLTCWLAQAWWLTRAWHLGWLAGLAGVLCAGGLLWGLGFNGLAVAVFGMACMALGVALSLAGIRAVLTPGIAVLGVARTLIDEALRMKTALGFILGLMLLITVRDISSTPQAIDWVQLMGQ